MGTSPARLSIHPQFSVKHLVISTAIGPHAHFDYSIGYFFSGTSQTRVGTRVLDFRPGDLGLLNPGQHHEDLPSPGERDYLTVSIKRPFMRDLLKKIGQGTPEPELPCFLEPKVAADPQMKRICHEIVIEDERFQYGGEVILQSLVTELAVHLLRRFRPTGEESSVRYNGQIFRWHVRRAVDYLHDTYTQEFSLEKLSEVAELSKYYLDRVFKKAIGLGPHMYMIALRMERAKELLASTSRPLADIALELGFSDQSHFSNTFRQFTGLSPRAYRIAASSNSKQSRTYLAPLTSSEEQPRFNR